MKSVVFCTAGLRLYGVLKPKYGTYEGKEKALL